MTTKPTLEQTVEEEDLRAKLAERGVKFDPDTSLEGLRELWATFGSGDPRADELRDEIERQRENEETTEPERELDEEPDPAADDAVPRDGETEQEYAARLDAADALATLTEPGGDEEETTAADAMARAQEAAKTAKTDPGTTTLFDPGAFDDPALALPAIDGHPIDRIALKFSGQIMLDRTNKHHVALWKRAKIGRELELWVSAKGTGFAGTGATNRDGELDVMVGQRALTLQTVRILAPEELDGAAREIIAQAREAAETDAAVAAREILDEPQTLPVGA